MPARALAVLGVEGDCGAPHWRPAAACLAGLVVFTFVFGGGAREDIMSLAILRPVAAATMVVAIGFAGAAAWRQQRSLILLIAAIAAVALAQLVPLPPGIWAVLPGHAIIALGFQQAGIALPWLPVSLTPGASWNAFFALLGPIAAIILALVVSRRAVSMLLLLILIIGCLSALLGLLQILDPSQSALFPYRITNNGSAVGVFANRNHHAIFLICLLPIAASLTRKRLGRHQHGLQTNWLLLAAGAYCLVLTIATGSRAGLLIAVPGVILALWTAEPIFRTSGLQDIRHAGVRRWVLPVVISGTAVALFSSVVFRSVSLERLLANNNIGDLRLPALPVIWQVARNFFPYGSGFGSFADVYKLSEPQLLLGSQYLNHAHNDFAEILLTGGLPGLCLLVWGLVLLAVAAARLAHSNDSADRVALVHGRVGISVLVILTAGSIADYPMRVPSLAILAALAAVMATRGARMAALAPRLGSESLWPDMALTRQSVRN